MCSTMDRAGYLDSNPEALHLRDDHEEQFALPQVNAMLLDPLRILAEPHRAQATGVLDEGGGTT